MVSTSGQHQWSAPAYAKRLRNRESTLMNANNDSPPRRSIKSQHVDTVTKGSVIPRPGRFPPRNPRPLPVVRKSKPYQVTECLAVRLPPYDRTVLLRCDRRQRPSTAHDWSETPANKTDTPGFQHQGFDSPAAISLPISSRIPHETAPLARDAALPPTRASTPRSSSGV